MTVMKRVLLMLFGVAAVSGVVLDSNQYFDRILSNFGREVTFYGLGLDLTRIQNFTQKLDNNLSECKMNFRMITSYQSAFAEKLDNDTVLCTYFQEPIYQLPTIRAEKGKTFAFYKEPEQVLASDWHIKWTSLQSNGIFYIYESIQLYNMSFSLCQRYPNGYVLRLKTTEDLNIFLNVVSILSPYYTSIDLIFGSNGELVWRDGTTFNETVAAGFFQRSLDPSRPNLSILVKSNVQINLYSEKNLDVMVICQVNLFQ